MTLLEMPLRLTAKQEQLVCERTRFWIRYASRYYQQDFALVPVSFDLKGRTAGMFRLRKNQYGIRYNPAIFAAYFDENLENTVPHEVAHYVCHRLWGRRAKPHGNEWRQIMAAFGVPAEVTCKLNIDHLPQRKLQRFSYRCACREHQLTSIRHNRVQNDGARYHCRQCGQVLAIS